jgi:rhodanese-related sulfurtransferase
MTVEVALYNEIIEAIVDQEVFLIDVREPQDIAATGSIPTSINIPRMYELFLLSFMGN